MYTQVSAIDIAETMGVTFAQGVDGVDVEITEVNGAMDISAARRPWLHLFEKWPGPRGVA